MDLRKALLRLLGSEPEAPPIVVVRAPAAAPTPAPKEPEPDAGIEKGTPLSEFEERLKIALRLSEKVTTSQIRFLKLDQIRESLGDRWARYADSVEAVATGIIERRLADFEVYTRIGELQYVMVLPTLDENGARIKCLAIADEITKRLLGDSNAQQNQIDIMTSVQVLDRDTVDAAQGLVATLRASFDHDAETPSRRAAPEPAAKQSGLAEAAAPPRRKTVYRPMWDLRRDVISTFLNVPETATMPPVSSGDSDHASFPSSSDGADHASQDLAALGQVTLDLHEAIAAGRTLLLAVPVHYDTLASGHYRDAYLRLCRLVPRPRGSFIIFELVDVPEGIPQTRLVELVGMVKPFARAILLRLQLDNRLFKQARDARIFAVGADLSYRNTPEADTIAAMHRFVQSANDAGLRTYVHGVRSASLALAAAGAGFDYMDGDSVTSVINLPERITKFGIRDLYRRPRAEN